MWHLWAFLTLTYRLSEPFTLTFRVTYLILGKRPYIMTFLLILTHISRRNPYLDTKPKPMMLRIAKNTVVAKQIRFINGMIFWENRGKQKGNMT